MEARRRTSPLSERRSVQAPGMIRHGPFLGSSSSSRHALDRHPRSELLENKIIIQEDEIEQLAADNHKLSATEVSLKQELLAVQQEVRKLKAHIRSNQTESDIQIRILLDKIIKMNADIKAGDSVKKDLQRAHNEAQTLVVARQDMAERIHLARKELQKTCLSIKSLPDLQSELDNLKQEYQILRGTFENEKSMNVEQVEQLKATERHLIGMAREVQRLRSEISNIEKRVQAPTPFLGPSSRDNTTFIDGYAHAQIAANPNVEPMISYGSSNGAAPVDVAAIPSTVGSAGCEGTYDPDC